MPAKSLILFLPLFLALSGCDKGKPKNQNSGEIRPNTDNSFAQEEHHNKLNTAITEGTSPEDLRKTAAELSLRSPTQALDLLLSNQQHFKGGAGLELILRIANENPESLDEWLRQSDWTSTPMAQTIAIALGRTNIKVGIEIFRKLPEKDGESFLNALFMSGGSPTDKLAAAQEFLSGEDLAIARLAIARSLSRTNPDQAFQICLDSENDPANSAKSIGTQKMILMNYLDKDGGAAMKAMSELPPIQVQALLSDNSILGKICEIDAKTGRSLLDKIIPTGATQAIFEKFASLSVATDPEGTLDWISSMQDSLSKKQLEGHALAHLSLSKPEQAAKWISSRLDTDEGVYLANQIGKGWARNNLSESLKWGNSLPAAAQPEYFLSVLNSAVEIDPKETATEFSEESTTISLLDPKSRMDLATKTAERFCNQDINLTLNWFNQLSESFRAPAARGIVSSWASRSPQDAATWLNSLPHGDIRDAGVTELVRLLEPTDPDRAKEWQETLSKSQ